MQLLPGLDIPLSGAMGFDLSDPFDCTCYRLRTAAGPVLFDSGVGRDLGALATEPPALVLLTHAHADHAGGAASLRARGARIVAGAATAALVTAGDERGISLDTARAAGGYPPDYRFQACPVDQVLADGETLSVGDACITALATPGHSADHMAYLVEVPTARMLVVGDALFHGGRVLLQNTWDCDVPALCRSIRRLASYDFDCFLPGHGPFSLTRGRRHAEAALAAVDRLLVPPALFWGNGP